MKLRVAKKVLREWPPPWRVTTYLQANRRMWRRYPVKAVRAAHYQGLGRYGRWDPLEPFERTVQRIRQRGKE